MLMIFQTVDINWKEFDFICSHQMNIKGGQSLEAISKLPNDPISTSDLSLNPQNMFIYSSGYDTVSSLTSNHFSNFEMAYCFIGSIGSIGFLGFH